RVRYIILAIHVPADKMLSHFLLQAKQSRYEFWSAPVHPRTQRPATFQDGALDALSRTTRKRVLSINSASPAVRRHRHHDGSGLCHAYRSWLAFWNAKDRYMRTSRLGDQPKPIAPCI